MDIPSNGDTPTVGGEAIGEIVEASTTGFRAVAQEAFAPPAFGSFVRTTTGERVVYAVVANVEHASLDPSRRAIPLGRSWEELRREQPQVFELLTSEFEAISVAFADGGEPMRPYLPPVPPRLHDFVGPCSSGEVLQLTEDLSFVRTLGGCASPNAGELIAAAIRDAADARREPRSFLLRAGREVADLYRGDYEQACAILRRLGMRVAGESWSRTPPPAVAMRRESGK